MPRGRKPGSKNKPKIAENPEDKSALEKEIILQRRRAVARKKAGKPAEVYNLIKNYDEEDAGPPKGNPTGHCKYCKREFEQYFQEDRNAYTSYRICPDCKRLRSAKQSKKFYEENKDTQEQEEVHVATLNYTPYDWQKEVEEAFWSHRFTVMACGNRSGKDRATMMIGIKYFVKCLQENRHVKKPDMVPPVLWWQIAPTEKIARQNWRELKNFFPKEWVVACSDSNFQMETIGGGIIEVRSGYDPQMLRGVGLDIATITEAALIKDLHTLWADVEARLNSQNRGLRGMHGKALINSSPIGRNDFYDLYCYGQKESEFYSSDWWSCRYPWTCNPYNASLAAEIKHTKYGDLPYEEVLRRQIGERNYRSNYLADFMANDGAVFKGFEENCLTSIFDQSKTYAKTKEERDRYIKEWKEPVIGEMYVVGYDPATGSSQDSPAVVVRQRSNGRIVWIADLYGKGYEQQYSYIESLAKKYNFAEIHWLRTGHTAIEGEFTKRGLAEVPLDEQGQKKGQLVQTLELAVENGAVQVLYDGSVEAQTLIEQMKDYTEHPNGKYSNDKAPHDDYVSALYAAYSDYSVHEIPIFYSPMMTVVR